MNPKVKETIESLSNSIPEERIAIAQPMIDFIQQKTNNGESISLNFICTHNSRRSHLSQVWAQAMAAYYGIKNVYCYSGGTEATAMFHMSAEALKESGFEIKPLSEGNNPIQCIKFDENAAPIIGFSKTYDDSFNPQNGFVAIMTCSSADEGCPFVAGSALRVSLQYEDPKAFDGTPQQKEKYVERSLQIATEMKYIFSQIKK